MISVRLRECDMRAKPHELDRNFVLLAFFSFPYHFSAWVYKHSKSNSNFIPILVVPEEYFVVSGDISSVNFGKQASK